MATAAVMVFLGVLIVNTQEHVKILLVYKYNRIISKNRLSETPSSIAYSTSYSCTYRQRNVNLLHDYVSRRGENRHTCGVFKKLKL